MAFQDNKSQKKVRFNTTVDDTPSMKRRCTLNYVEGTNRDTYRCLYCRKVHYKELNKICEHIEKDHCMCANKPDEMANCPIHKTIVTMGDLAQATRSTQSAQNQVPERSFSCEECERPFANKRSLTRHMRLHTGEKPHRCPQCDLTFSRKDMLRQHEQKVHIRSLKCSRCDKCFALKIHLTQHMTIHTGERPYHCQVCGKLFKRKYSLKCHMSIHSKERPYACAQCEKTYKSKRELSRHMHAHT